MAFTEQDAQADIASYQPPADKTAEPHPMATPAGTPPDPIAAAQTPPPAQVTPSYLDGVVSFVDKYRSHVSDSLDKAGAVLPYLRPVRDLASGAIKGGVELVDSAKSLLTAGPAVSETADENGSLTATEDKTPAPDPSHPIYDDARKAILGVRDAIAVKDPTLTDGLISGFGQFAGPWAAYSRILGSLGWAARAASIPEAGASFGARILAKGVDTAKSLPRLAAVDAAVNATANAPHDPRTADLFSLHNTAEGKFHDMLNTVSPDGSLVRHYIDYVANPDGSEAENRWKNVLDGFNVGAAVGGVFHVAAGTFRAGWGALDYMARNNMGSMGDLMPANQEGKIGANLQDMSLTPEQRALEREKVASQRDREEGFEKVFTPEPIPANAAEREGATARRMKEDQPVEARPKQPVTSGAFPTIMATDDEVRNGITQNRNTVNALRNTLQKFNDRAGAQTDGSYGQGAPLHSGLQVLSAGLSRSTPQGAFYGEVVDRLLAKNLDTQVVASGTGYHATPSSMSNFGTHHLQTNTIAIHQPALDSSNQAVLHTFVHEAVHAATVRELVTNPDSAKAFEGILKEAKGLAKPAGEGETSSALATLSDTNRYGLTDPKEFIAEAEANPRFQQALKDTNSADGTSLWSKYKLAIGQILGLGSVAIGSKAFDKLLTKQENDGA